METMSSKMETMSSKMETMSSKMETMQSSLNNIENLNKTMVEQLVSLNKNISGFISIKNKE